jgi:hypothetical protein
LLDFHPGPPCPTLLRPAWGALPLRRPAAVFYPFGHFLDTLCIPSHSIMHIIAHTRSIHWATVTDHRCRLMSGSHGRSTTASHYTAQMHCTPCHTLHHKPCCFTNHVTHRVTDTDCLTGTLRIILRARLQSTSQALHVKHGHSPCSKSR